MQCLDVRVKGERNAIKVKGTSVRALSKQKSLCLYTFAGDAFRNTSLPFT